MRQVYHRLSPAGRGNPRPRLVLKPNLESEASRVRHSTHGPATGETPVVWVGVVTLYLYHSLA
jgi:hypothetical protein